MLHLPWRYAQVDKFVADDGILEVDDEPMAKSIKDNFVEILLLDLPVSHHARLERVPLCLRHVHSCRIVVRMVGPALMCIFHMLCLCVPRAILLILNDGSHVVLGPAFGISW